MKNSGTGKPMPLSEGKDLRHIKVTLRKTTVRSCCLYNYSFTAVDEPISIVPFFIT